MRAVHTISKGEVTVASPHQIMKEAVQLTDTMSMTSTPLEVGQSLFATEYRYVPGQDSEHLELRTVEYIVTMTGKFAVIAQEKDDPEPESVPIRTDDMYEENSSSAFGRRFYTAEQMEARKETDHETMLLAGLIGEPMLSLDWFRALPASKRAGVIYALTDPA